MTVDVTYQIMIQIAKLNYYVPMTPFPTFLCYVPIANQAVLCTVTSFKYIKSILNPTLCCIVHPFGFI